MKRFGLDHSRFIASLLIVAIHIYPLASISKNLDFLFTLVICRVAVPLFLMITGYFSLPKAITDKNYLIIYIKKILKLYLICILLYLPINIYTGSFKKINILNILKGLLIDGTFYHLWYFPALILGLVLSYFIIKKCSNKQAILIVTILYLIGLFGDSYYGIISNVSILKSLYNTIFSITTYTRNGLFYVPIFLYIGYYFSNNKIKLKKKNSMILLIISTLLMLIEGSILYHFKLQRHNSMYILLIPVMFFIFHLLITKKENINKKLREISTIIYIIHPMFIIAVRLIAKIIHLENILIYNNLIHYLCVVILSFIFSITLVKVKEVVKRANSKRKQDLAQEE